MKNIDVPIGTVLPITDAFFMRLLTADYINGGKVLIYVDGRVTKPCEDVYRGVLIQPVSGNMLEATLLAKE